MAVPLCPLLALVLTLRFRCYLDEVGGTQGAGTRPWPSRLSVSYSRWRCGRHLPAGCPATALFVLGDSRPRRGAASPVRGRLPCSRARPSLVVLSNGVLGLVGAGGVLDWALVLQNRPKRRRGVLAAPGIADAALQSSPMVDWSLMLPYSLHQWWTGAFVFVMYCILLLC